MALSDALKGYDLKAASNRSLASGNDPTKGLFGKVTKALKLPELGISESFGGQTQSVLNKNQNVLSAATSKTSNSQPTGAGGGGGGGSFGGDSGGDSGKDSDGSKDPEISKGDIKNAASQYGGWVSDAALDSIIKKYSGESMDRANDLAKAIEKAARDAAEREYRDVMTALGGQKKEIQTLSEEQKRSIEEQKALGNTEIEQKEASQLGKIATEKDEFAKESTRQKDELGRAWRDMSMQVQSISRAGGRDSSSFAATQETNVLKEFNKGLRTLSEKSQAAFKSFSDAVVETGQWAMNEKNKLDVSARDAFTKVDQWVRGEVARIQNQENVALTSKFKQVEAALLTAQKLKTDVAQQVATAELNFGLAVAQMQMNYKAAVASAASKNEADALDSINETVKINQGIADLLEAGLVAPVQNGDGTLTIKGKLYDGTDLELDMTSEQFNSGILGQIALQQSKDTSGAYNFGTYDNRMAELTNQYNPSVVQEQPAEDGGSWLQNLWNR